MELAKKLESIVTRLRLVQDRLAELEARNQELLQENTALKTALARREKTVPALQNKLETAPRGRNEAADGVPPELDTDIRQQIMHYLSEIDKCIEWLSRQ